MHRWIEADAGAFTGRADEVTELLAVLERPGLVTLAGVGGVGKSRLAAQVAAQVRAGVFEAVYWVPLWSVSDRALAGAVVADACGLSDHSGRDPVRALGSWIGDRRVLLVLDSCEHVLAECAALTAELRAGCGRLTVLATSRQPLGTAGERVRPVSPLDPETDGLALFTAEAAARGVVWESPEDWVAAARVCGLLEGIPLALRLAAARLPQLSVHDMGRVLRRLTLSAPSGSPTSPARHDALRTTIGWSHELCEPLERLLWARLSVFRSAADREAVERVCGGGPLTRAELSAALAGLERKSLVSWQGGRLRMLDTIREYGEMWLAELGETAALADRHARYFGELVADAEREWWGPGQGAGYARLAACHGDLCAALGHLLVSDPCGALDMAGRVAFFWACCGHLHEAGHYLDEFLQLVAAPAEIHARAFWALGVVRCLQGRYEPASRLGRQARAAATAAGDEALVADAAYLEGLVLLLRGRPLAALHTAERALAGPVVDPAAGARCRIVLVFALTGAGLLDRAKAEARALRDRAAAVGEHWTRSYADYQLAVIALYQDRAGVAAGHARSMIRGKQVIGDAFGLALGLDLMAAALAAQGRGEHSAAAYGVGQTYWETVGHPQRGTPELGPLREQAQRAARERAGEDRYARAYRLATLTDPEVMVGMLLGELPEPW
ncbi:ATP-binding protein [Streptomyces sp. NPDC048603]|uniref:ATP-binding protein n=1 Tax=Streptomyces sp. NPDC048603 TaxID=3365577 RepID=UPI0037136704